ncbi:MAG: hypothetical protein ACM3RP_01860, partial [Chitinophagales bacterium]
MTEGASGLYLFSFRAALCGPLWREAGVVVAVNPVAGKGAPFSWRPGLEALWGVSELTGSPPGEVQAAYTWACAACRLALAPVLVEWESEVARRRARAEAELQRYYQRSLEEDVAGLHRVFHQVAVLQVRVTLARRSHTRRQFRRDLRGWEVDVVAQLGGMLGRAETLAYELQTRVRELARRYTGTVR